MTPGRPVTFVVTPGFLDHFGLESARDLPGLKELRAAGLLDARPLPDAPQDEDDGQEEMFTSSDDEGEQPAAETAQVQDPD